MVDSEKIVLMDKNRIARSLKRIAHQIAEQNREGKEILLVGINTRGFAVASCIQQFLASLYGKEIACHQLKVEEEATENLNDLCKGQNHFIVLVDDVIFSGSTMFKALVKLSVLLKIKEVHTATLIDRGHRKLPIDAGFVGMELSTKLNEHVSVEVTSGHNVKQVVLKRF